MEKQNEDIYKLMLSCLRNYDGYIYNKEEIEKMSFNNDHQILNNGEYIYTTPIDKKREL